MHILDMMRKSYPGGRGSLLIGEHYRLFLNLIFFFLFEADLIVWGVVGGSVSLFFSPPLAKYFPSQFPFFSRIS